ncbi:MAG: DUF2029 domain-containing protein [Elusimicrobia bacterium]|nr:DUF2029 domain-containing protein [Elusimicrobiota bacterium]
MVLFNIIEYNIILRKAVLNIISPSFAMFTQVGTFDPVRSYFTGDGRQQGFLCYGPYQSLPQGKYWVEYKLRRLDQDQREDLGKQLGYVDINVVDQPNYNTSSVFIVKDFRRQNPYTIKLKVNVPPGSPKLEYRVYQNAGKALQLETIKVYPADLLPGAKKIKAILVNLVLFFFMLLLFTIPWKRFWSQARMRKLLLILVGAILLEVVIYYLVLTTNILSGRFALSSQISSFDKENNINNDHKAGFLVYGPYWALKPGNYRIRFKILKHTTGDSGGNFGYLDVSSQEDPTVGASTELKDSDFQDGRPKELALRFKVKKGMPKVEFRAFSFGNVNFSVTGMKLESLGLNDAFLMANVSLLLCGIPLFLYSKRIEFGQGLTQSQKLKVITLILLAGMIISLSYHLFQGKVMGYTIPFNTFLYDPALRFSDYNQTYDYAAGVTQGKNPYLASLPSVYFPFTFIMLYPLTLLALKSSLFWYSVLTVLTFLFFIYNRTKSYVYPFLFALLSYPLMFLLDRGNIEGLLFLLLALFVYFYSARKYLLAVTVLAMAISLKLYPAVLLVLLLSEKRFREAVLCLLMGFLFSLSGLLFLQLHVSGSTIPGIVGNFLASLGQFKEMYYGDRAGSYDIAFNHTLYNSFKSLNILNPFINQNLFIRIYNSAVLILFGVISWYVIKVETVQWRKLALLVSAMIFLPNISFDYTLINLYLPLMLYLGCAADPNANDLPFILLFGLLLIPKNYFIISSKVSLSTFLSPLLILTLWALIAIQRVKERKLNIQETL